LLASNLHLPFLFCDIFYIYNYLYLSPELTFVV